MSTDPSGWINNASSDALRSLTRRVDEYVMAMVAMMGLTLEEMAERYELEYHSSVTQLDSDDVRLRFIQNVRIVRRPVSSRIPRETE